LIGLACLIGIVGTNFWLTERAQTYLQNVSQRTQAQDGGIGGSYTAKGAVSANGVSKNYRSTEIRIGAQGQTSTNVRFWMRAMIA